MEIFDGAICDVVDGGGGRQLENKKSMYKVRGMLNQWKVKCVDLLRRAITLCFIQVSP